MIVSAKGCWDTVERAHKIFFDRVVGQNLALHGGDLPAAAVQFLQANHATIRDGAEDDFRIIQRNFEKLLPLCLNFDRINLVLQSIYDYESFARKRKRKWCAYGLFKKSKLRTCPYCNLTYELTIFDGDTGVMRPALDHFFDKYRYPIFAISLGNLVPSCHHCNSTLKGSVDFFVNIHLNPLESGESIVFGLDIDPIRARHDLRIFDTAKIELNYDNTNRRIVNSLSTFYLEQRYNSLVDEIRTAARYMMEYSLSGSGDPIQKNWVLRGISHLNYKNQIMGRIFLDLASDYLQ